MTLDDFATFAHVVEARSFSRAAERLAMTSSAVSKAVRRLEEHLDTTLLLRSTRKLQVTEVGLRLYEHCARIVEEARAARDAVVQASGRVAGAVRLAVPVTFGQLHLVPLLDELRRRHPALRVDAFLDNAPHDLVGQGIDLAMRIATALPDSSLVVRRLGPDPWVVCASPSYLERRGTPTTPPDLTEHDCLIYRPVGHRWRFEGSETAVVVGGPLVADNGIVLAEAARAGLGVAMLPLFAVSSSLEQGTLHALLPEHPLPPRHRFVLLPQAGPVPTRTRAVLDLIVERWS